MECTKWKIGNGARVNFWTDYWLKPGFLLKDVAIIPPSNSEIEEKVRDFILPNGVWDRGKIIRLLPENICNEIMCVYVSRNNQVEDILVWNHPNDIDFTVKSAYKELVKDEQVKSEKHWDWVWKWPGSQRIRTFLWLCAHNKILTNTQRKKMNLTTDGLCPICRTEEETVTHVLRDCHASQKVWKMLVKPRFWPMFFKGNIVAGFLLTGKKR